MSSTDSSPGGDRYVAVHGSAGFKSLQRQTNSFLIRASVLFFGWWFTGTSLAAFAPGFFRQEIGGPVNVGLLFMFLTFVVVVTVCASYLRYAAGRLDPLTDQVRAELGGEPR